MEELLSQFSDYINNQRVQFPRYFGNGNRYRYWIYSISERNKINGTIKTIKDARRLSPIHEHSCVNSPYICYGPFLRNLETSRDAARTNSVFVSYMNKSISSGNYATCNFTWLTKDQIAEHINYCKERLALNFEFVIKENKQTYSVLFDFRNLSHLQVKFVLFWTRYVWEYPSNLALFDAMVLKKLHPEEELFNLLALASGSHRCFRIEGDHEIYRDQCICNKIAAFLPIETVHSLLNNKPFGRIENFFTRINVTPIAESNRIKLANNVTNTTDLSKWCARENVNRRLRYYENVLIPAAKGIKKENEKVKESI